MTAYDVGKVVWPDVIAASVWWLKQNLTGVNVRTKTDTTFATTTPNPTMTVPLVRIERVPGGALDANRVTEEAVVDLECFGADEPSAWALYRQVHGWMLRLSGQSTPAGVVDLVSVDNGAGQVNYSNPNVSRVVVTYRLASRAQTTL